MASSVLLKPCLYLMKRSTTSESIFFNPEKNPLLRSVLKKTLYKQFAAGEHPKEVQQTMRAIKDMGYRGVVLGYAKEFVSQNADKGLHEDTTTDKQADLQTLQKWKQGNLDTIDMVDPGDYVYLKFTGAGALARNALVAGDEMPEVVSKAMNAICEATAKKGCRLWVDAEQQFLQGGIDEWAITLMEKYNTNGKALIFNTIQAYLKGSRENLQRHLELAAQQGWTLGLKLVRGAYIDHEKRSLIHDSKEETDRSYNSIVHDLLNQQWPGISTPFPKVELFVASHNIATVEKALSVTKSRSTAGKTNIPVEFGQIQGMADDVSCTLLQRGHDIECGTKAAPKTAGPKVYKCLTWGTLPECLGYLYRRTVENKGAVERTNHMAQAARREMWRRLKGGRWARHRVTNNIT